MTAIDSPIYIDATMLLRWQHLAPVGIVRLERLVAGHLRFDAKHVPSAAYVVWERGYRPTNEHETAALDRLLRAGATPPASRASETDTEAPVRSRRVLASSRRLALKTVATLPESLQPLAEQAAWSVATFGVETARYVRRARVGRRQLAGRQLTSRHPEVHHSVDFSNGADLVALGLGWEYLDHESMYLLRRDFGVRIHMPAFDLIPISMPQMNAGQSHLVHRYYAEMAHYADSITSISFATQRALEEFFTDEELPTPHLSVNQLPGIEDSRSESGTESESTTPRHRFVGERYVLSVSTIEVRKNHVLLAKLWAECIREGVEMPKLVLVGRYGWDIDELRRWVDYAPELQDSFVICADVEDDELIELYRDALFTVFPSRIEGWGLPITESLGYGKVCIHSTDPAQLEASQGLMPALHPDDLPNWKSEVLRMVNDDEHRGALEARIASQFQMRTPAEYCATFEEILATRRASSEQP